jgi:hypothetical protein
MPDRAHSLLLSHSRPWAHSQLWLDRHCMGQLDGHRTESRLTDTQRHRAGVVMLRRHAFCAECVVVYAWGGDRYIQISRHTASCPAHSQTSKRRIKSSPNHPSSAFASSPCFSLHFERTHFQSSSPSSAREAGVRRSPTSFRLASPPHGQPRRSPRAGACPLSASAAGAGSDSCSLCVCLVWACPFASCRRLGGCERAVHSLA